LTLSNQEVEFIKNNREIIKQILEKRQKDILDILIDTDEDKQKIGLQYLARQFKEGLGILENITRLKIAKKKIKKKDTGI
jgi:hypothetical protein